MFTPDLLVVRIAVITAIPTLTEVKVVHVGAHVSLIVVITIVNYDLGDVPAFVAVGAFCAHFDGVGIYLFNECAL